jgi:ABC-type thiamin/hydroxymethylpyrimidine transport system permease subunit
MFAAVLAAPMATLIAPTAGQAVLGKVTVVLTVQVMAQQEHSGILAAYATIGGIAAKLKLGPRAQFYVTKLSVSSIPSGEEGSFFKK